MTEEIISNKIGEKIILLGNEAIARGALESGVQFVSAYPGTPSSEVGNTFWRIAKKAGVYFEFSTNEKVALEAGAGAAFSGLRTLVSMKHFGLNVASDFFMPLVYSGVKGGMVILIADDPSCWSSAQSEENTRAFASLAHIPILEPSTPQECKDFTKLAFDLSEKFQIPIMIRETTRVALQGGIVKLGKIVRRKRKGKFVKDPHQFSTMPPRVLEMKKELLEKIEKIKKEVSEKSSINKVYKNQASVNSRLGIITSSVSYLYVMEALKELNLNIPVLKLGFFYPLPKEKIKNFIKPLKKVLAVEELEPYLEKEITILAKDINPKVQIFGKNLLPEIGELHPEHVIKAVAKVANKKLKVETLLKINNPKLKIPKRSPQFCPGCPYWLVFNAIKKAVDPKKVIFGGEIGCYMLAFYPPFYFQDYLFCMGSSVGVAHGIKKSSNKQKLISFVGDSSFFHSGIPALLNAVHNKSNPLIIVMDNQTTAMTGHQPNPGTNKTSMGDSVEGAKIENIIRACGVKNLKIIDPIKQKEFGEAVKDSLNNKTNEVSVIIARRPCIYI